MSKDANDPTWQTEEETKFYQKIEDELAKEAQAGAEPDATGASDSEKPKQCLVGSDDCACSRLASQEARDGD